MGSPASSFINRAALGHQPGPEEDDPRNDVLTSAQRAEERKQAKYDAICAAGSMTFRARDDGRAKQMRDSGLPAKVLVGKLKKDISFALRRGTIAQVTTALDAAQRTVDEEDLTLN
jgi:hypothetical protein